MSLNKPSTSAGNQENISLKIYDGGKDEVTDTPSKGGLRRASTNAQESESRPKPKVRFYTLSPGTERQLSNEAVQLLSTQAHQISGTPHWSGGWQNTVLRRRRQGLSPQTPEEEVLEIAQAMEEDHRLMTDDVDGEVLRRDALRELPKSLKVKREIKERLTLSKTSLRRSAERNLSYFKMCQYLTSMKWYKFKENIGMAWRDYPLWHKDLKDIEGIFGTSVGSYFRFLRYLFLLNSAVAFIIIGFLLIPQLLYGNRNESAFTAKIYSKVSELNTSTIPAQNSMSKPGFGALDWLTGAGWFSGTLLYYGGYDTGWLHSSNSTVQYNMSEAYFFTISFCFALYFIILFYRIFTMYRTNFIDTPEDLNVKFIEKIISAWDFSITDEKSANIKRRSVYNELMEMLQEFLREEEIKGFFERLCKRALLCAVWFVLVTFLLLLGWGLYLLLKDQLQDLAQTEDEYWKESFELLVYPLIVTLLMVVIPLVFEAIGRMEKYSNPRFELYANLVRVCLLDVVILVALVVFWYEKSPGLSHELKTLKQKLMYDAQSQIWDRSSPSNQTTVDCWESALGQEIYRLVFIDFLVILVSTLVIDTLRPILVKRGKANEDILQFGIVRNTLHIIYNQTLLWAGLFFCPLLPLIISLKFCIIFYLQKFSVTRNHQPTDRPWRAAQTETVFYCLTLISLILAFLSYVFIAVRGYCSPECGPFEGYTHYKDIVTEIFGTTRILINILSLILHPGSILLSILILSLVVYAMKNVSEGRSQLVEVLRDQLEMEVKDRVFLQRLIEKVNRGEYHPKMRSPPREGTPGSPTPRSPTPRSPFAREEEPKRITKKSSFIFFRSSSSGVDEVDGNTDL